MGCSREQPRRCHSAQCQARSPSRPWVISGVGATKLDALTIVILLLVVLWMTGFGLHLGGGLIHLLLVVAVVVLIVRLLQSKASP